MTAIDKALDALLLLGRSAEALRLRDVAARLGLPRSSTHRVLTPLVRRGLAEQDQEGRYRVGYAVLGLGLGVARRDALCAVAQDVLEAAAAELGETFFLVVARGGRLVVMAKAEGNGFLRAAPQLGTEVPVHATAAGKLYLAHAPERVEEGPLQRYTARTLRARRALDDDVARARSQGYASNLEEWQAGLCVVAAPILAGSDLAGVVALAMVAARFEAIGITTASRRVRHAAEGIALRLEGTRA